MARAQASLLAAVAIVAAAAVFGAAAGASYTVGGLGGSWDLQTNLTAWASTIDFRPGDQLVFKYDASAHDVVQVGRDGYRSCSPASNVSRPLRTGSDVVQLAGIGRFYFICGVPGHCDAGMKLQVRLVAPGCNSPPAAEATNGTPGGPGENGSPGGVCLGGDSPTTIITPPGINNDGSAPGSPSLANHLTSFLVVTMVSLLLGLLV